MKLTTNTMKEIREGGKSTRAPAERGRRIVISQEENKVGFVLRNL
jgi:hypothetical protein